MKREDLERILPIMEAYKNGSEVQYFTREREWITIDNPDFNPKYQWRVKPEIDAVYFLDRYNKFVFDKPINSGSFIPYIRKDYVTKLMSKLKTVCGNSSMRFIEKEIEKLNEL